mgnify:CR=1 FL=1
MELYIRITDGKPVDHPILGDNFRQVFPHIDVNNLPSDFARFTRITKPEKGPYQVLDEQPTYQWVGSEIQDVWNIRDMTAEEKAAFIEQVMQRKPFPSWTFDEPTCSFLPPVSYPEEDGKIYQWNEETLNWVEYTLPTE